MPPCWCSRLSASSHASPPPRTITEIIDSTGDGVNGLATAFGVAVDSLGNAYVTGVSSQNVFKITPGGTITEIIDSTGDGVSSFSTPHGIAVDSLDNVYVDGNNNAFKIDTPGTCSTGGTPCIITEIIDSTGDGVSSLSFAVDVAVDSLDNTYVAAANSHNVFKITPGGSITEIIDSTGDGVNAFSIPQSVAVDSLGNVYVTGFNSDNVFRITPGGSVTEIIDSTGDGVNISSRSANSGLCADYLPRFIIAATWSGSPSPSAPGTGRS